MGFVTGWSAKRRMVRLAGLATAAVLAVAGQTAARAATGTGLVGAAPASIDSSTPLATYSASFGYTGHAGLYGYGMAYDAAKGTILVADVWNYRVQVFSESGAHIKNVGKVAPRGAQGGMGAPFGVAADPDGNIWVGDQSNSRVVEFNYDTGAWMQSIGSGGGPNTGENYAVGCGSGKMTIPTHVAIDPTNRDVYVTDPRCDGVYVFNSTGTFLRQFTWSTLKHPIPRGIGMDSAGNVYVAEFNTRKIYVFNKAGQQLRAFAAAPNSTDMADVRGLAVDNVNQRVYAVGAENNKVVVFGFNGSYVATWSSAGSTAFNSIRFIATDQVGDVYVSDLYGYAVYKLDKDGNPLPWSTGPQPPPNGGWNQLNGIGVDAVNGNLYGVDTFGNRVQRFGTTGGQSCPSKTSCATFQLAFGQRGPLNPNTANLDYPHVIAVDHNANAVFVDGTNSVLRFDLNGNFVSGWGSHGPGIGQFQNGPQGMEVVPSGVNSGTVYTTDVGTCRLQVFDYSGNLQSYMGTCGKGTDQMSAPRQIAVDAAHGLAYVADTGNSRIVEWNLATKHIVATFGGPVGGIHLNQPKGVTLDPTGSWLYIGDSNNKRVVRVSPSLSAASAAVVTTGSDTPKGHFGGPEWLDFSKVDGRLFVSDNNQSIYAYTIGGSSSGGGSTSGAEPAFVQTIGHSAHPSMAPSGIDVDPQGTLYVADTGDSQVAAYRSDGSQLWRVGKRGTKANGNFLNPRDVAYSNGLVYVADTGNNRIQVLDATTGLWQRTFSFHFSALMGVSVGVDGSGNPVVLAADSTKNTIDVFTTTGSLVRSVGSAGSGNGQLNQARDAVTDTAGNIFVADFKNERVEEFSAAGSFLRAWGTKCPYSGCSQPGQFKDPYGIVRDAAGHIYVSDNIRIQEFTPTGTFVAQFGQSCPKGGCTGNQLFQLRRVAVGAGSSPAVYAADLWGYKVVEYDQSGAVVKVFGNTPPPVGGFNDAFGLTLNAGVLTVADTNNQRVETFNAITGAYQSTFAHRGYGTDLSGVNWPRDIVYSSVTNTYWLADTKNYRLTEHAPDGTPTGRVIGSTGATLQPSILNWTYGLGSWNGDVVTADTFNNRVELWDGSSSTTPVWTATGMKDPEAVAVSGNTIYVADTNAARVVKLDAATGAALGTISGYFGHPDGIAVAPSGNIWVADAGKNHLVEVTPGGTLVQTFGSYGSTTSKQFNGPSQLAIGPGSAPNTTWLYVMDSNNDRVQVYDITNS